MTKGAMIAPHDWVENANPVWAPLAWKLAPRKVPSVTNQQPQMKNCRNIIALSRAVIMIRSCTVCFPPRALDRNALRRHHFVLEGKHRGGGFIDRLHERERALQYRCEARLVLDARRRVLVLHHQVG